jgi:glycosyltransferase involved in cell wall biosynthesis
VRVLVAGNDLRRDWATAARAFAGDQRFEVVLLSRREHVAAYAAYGSNLRYVRAGQLRSLLDWYAWADVAVIASQPNSHGAGLTMLLEAAAVGIPLICTRTGDIDEYLPEVAASYVPPQDAAAMRRAAQALLRDPDAAERRAALAQAAARSPELGSAAAVEHRCRIFHERRAARGRVAATAVEDAREPAGSGSSELEPG